ncbi:MAG: hypothetical protein CL927_05665 [Deltaproteobacteria bacterium]|nr:hypothetical protein [Deltaproteobacteria bacterium]
MRWLPIGLLACGTAGTKSVEERADSGMVALDPVAVTLQAGNAASDEERYRIFAALGPSIAHDSVLYAEWADLLSFMDQWTHGLETYWQPGDQDTAGEGGYLAGFFVLSAVPGVTTTPSEIRSDSPFYPLWCLYRGRMLIWFAIEMGFSEDAYYGEGRDLLGTARATFTDNPVLPTYLDEPVPWTFTGSVPSHAPDWAVAQRELLHKLTHIITYWATVRQAPDGQLGGGWGDDVEAWRRWTPVLLGFDDPVAREAQTLLSTNLFELPRMDGGYTSILTDVEHSSEDSADTITSMLFLEPDSAVWQERARTLVELFESTWSATNDQGFRQFRSTYFTSFEVSEDPDQACDTNYHIRALQPAILLWQRTEDPSLGEPIAEWMENWVAASASSERGKPAGIVPSSVQFPSGLPGGPGADWWNPGCHYNNETFRYPRYLSGLLRTLLLTEQITEESVFLEPIEALAELRRSFLEGTLPEPTEGNLSWAVEETGGALRDVLSKRRLLTGDPQYDDLLEAEGSAYMRYSLSGDEQILTDAVTAGLAALSHNEVHFTSEVRFTDRIFQFHNKYANQFQDAQTPTLDAKLLYNMVTGDVGDHAIAPLNAVRWHTEATDIAILVTGQSTDHLSAKLFHFGEQPREMGAELLRLTDGTRDWSLTCDEERVIEGSVSGSAELSFTLPPQVLCTLTIGAAP